MVSFFPLDPPQPCRGRTGFNILSSRCRWPSLQDDDLELNLRSRLTGLVEVGTYIRIANFPRPVFPRCGSSAGRRNTQRIRKASCCEEGFFLFSYFIIPSPLPWGFSPPHSTGYIYSLRSNDIRWIPYKRNLFPVGIKHS